MTNTNDNKRIARITQKMTGEYFAYDEAAEIIDETARGFETRRQLIARLKIDADSPWDYAFTHYRNAAGKLIKLL
jgi:hypothetical protein